VATNTTLMVEAIEGCVVMVVFVIALGTPTINGAVSGCPGTGGCLIRRAGNLRSSESFDDDLSSRRAGIPHGVTDTGT